MNKIKKDQKVQLLLLNHMQGTMNFLLLQSIRLYNINFKSILGICGYDLAAFFFLGMFILRASLATKMHNVRSLCGRLVNISHNSNKMRPL